MALKFNLILFDLDGVIIDSIPVIKLAFGRAFHEVMGPNLTPPFEEYQKYLGRTLNDILKALGLPATMKGPFVRESINLISQNRLFDGIEALLKTLKMKGCQLGLATSKEGRRARMILEYLKVLHYFDYVIGGHEVPHSKPAPDMLLKHLEYFNCSPIDALMVGDAPADMQASRAAHIPFAAAVWNDLHFDDLMKQKPDFILKEPGDLLKL